MTTSRPESGRPGTPPFLSLLQNPERYALLEAGTVRTVPTGTVLYTEGRRSAKIVLLLTAHARVLRRLGGRERCVAYRGPGDILGELSLVDGLPHAATVRVTRSGRVAVLTHEAFDRVMRRHDGIRTALLRVVVQRLRGAERLRDLGREPVRVAVARLLHHAGHGVDGAGVDGAGADGPPVRFQHQIAELLGVSRSSVVRALTELRRQGLLTTGHGVIEVVDRDRLGALLADHDRGTATEDEK
ncbi:Crp/Fnr family transcriptional regulator [Actinomadura kijaniata]|uniref:Crp/Fnr family transcriptional regulator n=1 Tax=Actinomadura kijaniata TaxID=46161 RepID=UPI0012FCF8E4|nr:Crp/Fnr family transcriptional regulator [Actinomadura kijaniata]